jgi:cytochrome c5
MRLLGALLVLLVSVSCGRGSEPTQPSSAETSSAADARSEAAAAAARGYRFLTEKAYLPADFDQEAFDALWRVWPRELREQAAEASLPERRRMAMERYGLSLRPDDASGKPLQYVVDEQGRWTMNCFACHGGSVYGKPTPGAPNNRYALQTLSEEMRRTKFRLAKPLTRMDLASAVIPLGTTHGTTNAVVFGVALMHLRDPQLNVLPDRRPPAVTHHDMDAPPWWHFSKRPNLYIDGFAERGHRGLMQFMLVRENGPEKFREWESDFRDVYHYMMSLQPPRYDGPVDTDLAARGETVFLDHCAECHGTYGPSVHLPNSRGPNPHYPNRRIPIESLGTDPVRLTALPVQGREKYAASWFARAGEPDEQTTVTDPSGYVAPPLDGVWASPPYFHNGSVPTLWHVLHPEERPTLWRRTAEAIDPEKVGFQIVEVDRVPLTEPDIAVRRQYFDTRKRGKSAGGHHYPDALNATEKRAVLEYLKTL